MSQTQIGPRSMQWLFLAMYITLLVCCYAKDGVGFAVYGAFAMIAGVITCWQGSKH